MEQSNKNSMEYLTTRKIKQDGTVNVNGVEYFVSTTVAGKRLQIFEDKQGLAAGHTGAGPSFRLQSME
ncbi:MAG: hypothetical protein KDK39_01325 [Leptospiraceae bacterium]|nr:hypothetical protein [Leptospiraceae bacterium]